MRVPAIVTRGLEKRFGWAVALAGIDLEVAQGAALAVLGPNGAGKSTLLRLLAGLARPSAGTVEIAGERAHGRAARARIGLIAHASLLYPALSARENLVFAARLYGIAAPHARADALLDEPFTGLDRRSAARLAARLMRLRDERRTLVLVTHDVAAAAQLADRAIVLARGRVAHASAGPLDAAALERSLAAADAP